MMCSMETPSIRRMEAVEIRTGWKAASYLLYATSAMDTGFGLSISFRSGIDASWYAETMLFPKRPAWP